jgi:uncharacterized protein (UPF0332 family)
MPFDHGDFLRLARELIDGEGREDPARIRTACGRAYYAAYGSLRLKLAGLGDLFRGKGYHRQLIDACGECGVKTVKKLSKRMKQLWEYRSDADYKPEIEMLPERAETAISIAEDLGERIRNLAFDNVRALHHELNRHIAHLEEGTRRPRP